MVGRCLSALSSVVANNLPARRQRTAHEASQSEKTGLLSEMTGLRRSRGHNQPVDLERSRLDARDQVAPELGRVGNRFKAADQE